MDIKIFRRVEKKYLLTKKQYNSLMKELKKYIEVDTYDYSTICNIYFDTEDYLLINRSIEKPKYKEKIRLRSYGIPSKDSKVFLEIKKKYKGLVSKRRIAVPLKEIYRYLQTGKYPNCEEQIMNEIDYCFKFYKLKPKVFLAYDRYAYKSIDNNNFRITFDTNIRSRTEDLYLENALRKINALAGYTLWFVNLLSSLKIYTTSFSKYGNVYKKQIFKKEA